MYFVVSFTPHGWFEAEDTPMANADDGKPDEVVKSDETDTGGIADSFLANYSLIYFLVTILQGYAFLDSLYVSMIIGLVVTCECVCVWLYMNVMTTFSSIWWLLWFSWILVHIKLISKQWQIIICSLSKW